MSNVQITFVRSKPQRKSRGKIAETRAKEPHNPAKFQAQIRSAGQETKKDK
jgi:hypothetical protein